MTGRSVTMNLKDYAAQTLSGYSQIQNSKFLILVPLNTQPSPSNLNLQLETLNPQTTLRNPQISTYTSKPSNLNPQPTRYDSKPSNFESKLCHQARRLSLDGHLNPEP